MKLNGSYSTNLIVKKVFVIFTGDVNYPFCCDIFATNNFYFRCAVKTKDLANFVLAQEGDELYLSLTGIYENSSVMGIDYCKNLTRSFSDLENLIREDMYHPLSMVVKKTFVIPMPFILQGAHLISQNDYFCLILNENNQYVWFETEAINIPHIVSALENDPIELSFYAFSQDDKLALIRFYNHARNILDFNLKICEIERETHQC